MHRLRSNYSQANDSWVCELCKLPFSSQSNVCRHIRSRHPKCFGDPNRDFDQDGVFISKADNGKQIPGYIVKLLKWKNKHAITMRAICSRDFEILIQPEYRLSREKLNIYQKEIAEQVLENNIRQLRNCYSSLILDSGKVLGCQWLSVSHLASDEQGQFLQLLDMVHMKEGCASVNIVDIVRGLKAKLAEQDVFVIGACTDNAANFVKCFFSTTKKPVDAAFPVRGILRVSCACHTGQLVLVDLADRDPSFNALIGQLRDIKDQLNNLSFAKREACGLSYCPRFLEHRYNSALECIQYILKHFDALIAADIGLTDSVAHLLDLSQVLQPLNDFTNNVSGDFKTQAHVYLEYRTLKKRWLELGEKEIPRAHLLVELLDKRFHETLDIELSYVCYIMRKDGMKEFCKQYPYYSDFYIEDADKGPQILARSSHLNQIRPKIIQICSIWEISADPVCDIFDLITREKQPENTQSNEYMSEKEVTALISTKSDTRKIKIFHNFLMHVQTLPASESVVERTFAVMRGAYNCQQHRLHPETIRAMIIIARDQWNHRETLFE